MNRRRPSLRKQQTFSPALVAGFVLFCAATAFTILMLTGYTYQLDDIKITGLVVGGGACLLGWSLLWLTGKTPMLPWPVWGAYAGFLAACLVSIIFAADFTRWIGWQYVWHYTSAFGFVALGAAVVQNRRMVELSLKFWALLTFATAVFGLLHYFGVLELFYRVIYPSGRPATGPNRFHDVLLTFVNNRSMLSTILNVQFFGNFLLMVLPVTAALTMVSFQNLQKRIAMGDPVAMPSFWLIVSASNVVLSIACIFLTYSKSSWLFLPFVIVFFLLGVYLIAGVRRIPYFGLIMALGGIMAATLLYFSAGDLRRQLQGVEESVGPRTIIFGGAWAIFKDHPITGAGPGSFRLVFPEYRDPDYHLNRISNLTLYAHNWVLDLLAETGILGTFFYLAFLAALFWIGLQAVFKSRDTTLRIAVMACGLGLLAILGGALLTPMTRWPVGVVSLHAMLGTFLGISWFTLREALAAEQAEESDTAPGKTPLLPPKKTSSYRPGQYVLLGATALYLVLVVMVSARQFRASALHNMGIRHTEFSDIPPGPLNEHLQNLFRQGVEYFEKSLEKNPASPTTYYKLGNAYNRLGQIEDALNTYERLMAYAPNYSEIHFNVGVIHYNLGLRAADEANAAREEGNEERAAELAAQSRQHLRACVEAFERAGQQSNKISVQFYRGTTMLTATDRGAFDGEEARLYYRTAGEVLMRAAELPLSTVIQETGQQAVELDLRFRAATFAIEAYRKAGEPGFAARAAESYVRLMPTNLGYIRQAVQLYREAEEYDRAIALLEDSLRLNPFSPTVQLMKFDVLNAAGRDEEAEEHGKYLLLLDRRLQETRTQFLNDAQREGIARRLAELAPAQAEEAGS